MIKKFSRSILAIFMISIIPIALLANSGEAGISIGGINMEFFIFGLTLLGIALFHNKTLEIALLGLILVILYKVVFHGNFMFYEHFFGHNDLQSQFFNKEMRQGEWGILLNLFGLLLGFGILAKVFEESGIPEYLPRYLPNDWKGPAMLLICIFVFSSFLDNIAAAMIGASIALVVFEKKVHIGYIAAIVAASNAGGSGSIVGDTTTTMMWIDGVSPFNVLHAYVAAIVALIIIVWFAAHQQDKFQRIMADPKPGIVIDYTRLGIVFLILIGAIVSNVYYDLPALGVWAALIIGSFFRKLPWYEAGSAFKGTIFLLSLVTAASLMPVETLPNASWQTALILGFVSAIFDNIPLTKLCLEQGHFDWGILAYAVGFGGSMMWFGSSAGVAITNKFPDARNVGLWLRHGWYIVLAYVVGFFVLYLSLGWHPTSNKKHSEPAAQCKVIDCKSKLDILTKE